jgi:hypothetical protein
VNNAIFRQSFKNFVKDEGIFEGSKLNGKNYSADMLIIEILDAIWLNLVYQPLQSLLIEKTSDEC